MTSPAPTPNDMPGAPAAPNPQLQVPVSTGTPPAPTPPPAAPAAAPADTAPPATPAKDDKAPDGTDWKSHAKTWEQRALDNQAAAQKWEEAEAARRTKEENQAIEITQANARAEKAEREARLERVARETGVLPMFLGSGTEDEMRAAAAQAIEWRGTGAASTPPPPQTAAVSASTVTSSDNLGHAPNQLPQLTKEQFIALPPDQRMGAVRAGQCENLGIGKPQGHRRMGNQYELGATGGKQ